VHEGIEALIGLFLPLVGEVEVEHGGFELGMAQITLDETRVHAGFEQMGRVRMPERISTLLILRRSPRSIIRIILSLDRL
jgi:hypothetical protein